MKYLQVLILVVYVAFLGIWPFGINPGLMLLNLGTGLPLTTAPATSTPDPTASRVATIRSCE